MSKQIKRHPAVIFPLAFFIVVSTAFLTVKKSNPETPKKIKMLIVGDLGFGETYQERLEAKGEPNILKTKGYDYCVEKLGVLNKQADIILANLETPLTTLKESPLADSGKYRLHKGDAIQTTAVLKKNGIKVVSLANNHTMDYGTEGLLETFKTLTTQNIAFLGAGKDAASASRPFWYKCGTNSELPCVIVLAGLPFDDKYEGRYHFYAEKQRAGINLWTEESVDKQVREVRSQYKEAFIIVYPHWLENYRWKSKKQSNLAHAMIDAGADLLIGQGTHMFQEIELYKGKWIIYSLGNYVFNSPGRYHKKKEAHPFSLAASLEIQKEQKENACEIKLYPILSDNARTNFQPRFVNKLELDSIKNGLLRFLPEEASSKYELLTAKDSVGFYFQLSTVKKKK